jgi:hypothetical protein
LLWFTRIVAEGSSGEYEDQTEQHVDVERVKCDPDREFNEFLDEDEKSSLSLDGEILSSDVTEEETPSFFQYLQSFPILLYCILELHCILFRFVISISFIAVSSLYFHITNRVFSIL